MAEWTGLRPGHLLGALGLVAVTTIGLLLLDLSLRPAHVSIIFIIPVLIAAARWGLAPAVVTALASIAAATFFFYPPLYSLRVSDPQHMIDLTLFMVVAFTVSQLASDLKMQADIARHREQEMGALCAFSRQLAAAQEAADIYAAIHKHVSSILRRNVALIGPDGNVQAAAPVAMGNALPDGLRDQAVRFSTGGGDGGPAFMRDAGDRTWLIRAVAPHIPELGVIAVDLGSDSTDAMEDTRQRVELLLAEAGATLERLDLAQAISAARTRSETDLLRDALIGSVSHELRSPLAAILGAATVLLEAPATAADQHLSALAGIVRDEAERLNNDIQNLLDATRISSQGVRPHMEWAEPADVINAAVERKRRRLSTQRVEIVVGHDLPLVHIDPVLVEQALGQILDNAAKYSPAGSLIRIEARATGETVTLSVLDEGAGLTSEECGHLYERFYRGRRHSGTTAGSGLGLWIAHAFVGASGGELEAGSAGPGCGTLVSIALPASDRLMAEMLEAVSE